MIHAEKDIILSINAETGDPMTVSDGRRTVNIVPFGGTAESAFFKGRVLPAAADTQTCTEGGCELSARYMLEGSDCTGADCRIFIENNGTSVDGKTLTKPVIVTDSRALGWLNGAELTGEVTGTDNGVRVDISEKTEGFVREEHFFGAGGEDIIFADLYIPESIVKNGGKCPVVIYSHGFNSSSWQVRDTAERIAAHGIGVYCLDFRGGCNDSKSTGSTLDMSIESEQRDLLGAIEDVKKLEWADSERIYLVGESQGGLVTALTAPLPCEPPKGIFLIYPAFCIPGDWEWAVKNENALASPVEFNGMMIGRAYVDGLPRYDVFAKAAEYKGRAVIFHGENDSVVAVEHSRRLKDCYDNAELYVYPGQDHGFEDNYKTITASIIAREINNG